MNDILSHCHNLISQPDYRRDYLNSIRKNSRGITGYFSNYIPQEIIAAAGFHPVRIIGFYESSKSHTQAISNPICSFVQDIYTVACSGELSYLSNIIFPNSCDSLKVLCQMWTDQSLQPPAYNLLHSIKTDHAAIEYFAGQIKAMGQWLTEQGGIELDFAGNHILDKINTYNKTRNLLRQLYEIRVNNPECLAGSDLFTVMTAGLIMDRSEYNRVFTQLVEQMSGHTPEIKSDQKRIMIIGPLLDNIDLLKKIEEFGACIVADEITNGWRYFDQNVDTQGDLYENLARRYLSSSPSPTLYTDPKADDQAFRKRIETIKPDGVLFIIQKFCEPHIHNYLSKKEILTSMGINTLMLEIEHNRTDITQRDLLRLESFLEVAQSHTSPLECHSEQSEESV